MTSSAAQTGPDSRIHLLAYTQAHGPNVRLIPGSYDLSWPRCSIEPGIATASPKYGSKAWGR